MWIQDRWLALCRRTAGTDEFWSIAVDHRAARAALAPLIERFSTGIVLDAGAGQLAWRPLLQRHATLYIAVDRAPVQRELSVLCDLQGGLPFADDSVDTVFCCSVLEHVEDPRRALSECARVLKPGGRIILSVPFLYYLHGAPQDFFRFTLFGVDLLARQTGLRVIEISASGGATQQIFQFASMLAGALLGTTVVGRKITAAFAGALWRIGHGIDRLDSQKRLAQNINAVLGKMDS